MSTSSQPCNSTALAPRSSRFPYVTYLLRSCLPMAGIAQRLKSRFGHFLALTVPSAVGFAPLPFRLRPDGNPPLQHAATRRHRTQTYAILSNFWHFSFAKYRTLRKNLKTQYSCGFAGSILRNSRLWKSLLTFRGTCYIMYSSHILSVFAKYDTLRNFFMKKDALRRPFSIFRVRPIGF